jgi:hypothetical protein
MSPTIRLTNGSVLLASSSENRLTERDGETGLGVIDEEPAMSEPPFYSPHALIQVRIMMRLAHLSIRLGHFTKKKQRFVQ